MSQGTTINADAYCQVLQDLRMSIWHKWARWLRRFILLQHDNACAHRVIKTQNLLRQFGWTVFEHPVYISDLTTSDYQLFPELKKYLSGQQFIDDTG